MSNTISSVNQVKEWRPLIVALAIILAIFVAAIWYPAALWPIVQVAPYLMQYQ